MFILLKPSLAPFALVGIKTKGWWLGFGVLVLGSLPFLADTLIYPRVVADAMGAGLLYSALSIPVMLVALVPWLARSR